MASPHSIPAVPHPQTLWSVNKARPLPAVGHFSSSSLEKITRSSGLAHRPHRYFVASVSQLGESTTTAMVYKQTIEPDVLPTQQPPQQSSFPSDLPPRSAPPPSGQSWKERNCPGMRTCWSFSFSSYSLKDVDNGVRLRRICMITVLALRTVISVLSCVAAAAQGHIAGVVIYAIIGVIGLWFIAWCLARIGDCTGQRRVFGVVVVSA